MQIQINFNLDKTLKKIKDKLKKMSKNIFISHLPQIPIKEMVEIWWKFGEIENYIYIKKK